MKRIYEVILESHLSEDRQMIFLVGPRQVGKTTTSLDISKPRPKHFYLNYDAQVDRKLIIEGEAAVAEAIGLHRLVGSTPIVVFDELHKYPKWKGFLKGFFDKYGDQVQIIVTESARLDVYKAGGDSLMGRYFLYRLHPISVGELISHHPHPNELASQSQQISEEEFQALINFGGFPEPFLRRSSQFYTKWKKLRLHQLFVEDLRDLTKIQEMGGIELLAQLLEQQAGQLLNYSTLANKVNVSIDTIRRWIETLKSFYYCFTIQPWTRNVTRSLLKEPKLYLWDWSFVQDEGAKLENLIASHLLKAIDFWTDRGLGDYQLYFLRDKEKREVDFLVSKNGEPWFLVEVKKSDTSLSKSLFHYQEMTKAPHAFQVVFDLEYEEGDCFQFTKPIVVSAKTFLSQLV